MKTHLHLFALAVVALLLTACPALAAGPAETPIFAAYFDDFIAYWKEKARQQNSIVMGVFILGAVALLIIRSAGRKLK